MVGSWGTPPSWGMNGRSPRASEANCRRHITITTPVVVSASGSGMRLKIRSTSPSVIAFISSGLMSHHTGTVPLCSTTGATSSIERTSIRPA